MKVARAAYSLQSVQYGVAMLSKPDYNLDTASEASLTPVDHSADISILFADSVRSLALSAIRYDPVMYYLSSAQL